MYIHTGVSGYPVYSHNSWYLPEMEQRKQENGISYMNQLKVIQIRPSKLCCICLLGSMGNRIYSFEGIPL